MYKKISKRELKCMLLTSEEPIEVNLCSKGRDVNHLLSSKMSVDIAEYNQLQEVLDNGWVKFSGSNKEPQLCIWIDDEEELED